MLCDWQESFYSDSRLLIKEILSEMYTDDKNIKKASYRINGIISSALSHRETMTKEENLQFVEYKIKTKWYSGIRIP